MDHKLIQGVCGSGAYQRGENYFRNHHVLNVEAEQTLEGWLIHAQVRGSRHYRQTIIIKQGEDTFRGHCSCPVTYNCKHVVATLLFALDKNLFNLQSQVFNPVEQWLDELDTLVRTPVLAAQQGTSRDRILYILEPGSGVDLGLDVLPQKVRLLKKGGYGKPASYSLDNLSPMNRPSFLASEDCEIARLLVDEPDYSDYAYYRDRSSAARYELSGDMGELALHKMLLSGRCHWLESGSEVLHLDDTRELSFNWASAKRGAQQLTYHAEPGITAIAQVAKLWYIDAKAATLGVLRSGDLSPEQVAKLVHAPQIPKSKLEAVSRRLLIDMPSYQLPTPLKLDIKEVHIQGVSPQFQLRLHSRVDGGEGAPEQTYHCAQLGFKYHSGEDSIVLTDFSLAGQSSVSDGDTVYRVERDTDAEFAAIETLLDIAMVLDKATEQTRRPTLMESYANLSELIWRPFASTTVETVEQWYGLLDSEFPRLQDQGWEIINDDSFALSFIEAEQWHGELEEGDNEWFTLSLGIELDGEPINLLPTLVRFLAEFETPQHLREYLQAQPWVLVLASEHRWLKLPSERLQSIFDTLVELYNTDALDDAGKLRLSRHQGMQLNDLLNDPALVWYGSEALKDLNARLRNFEGIEAVAPPPGFNAELRPYQQQGLNWLQFLREYQFNGILADDMGLGKTVQTLAHLLIEKQSGRMHQPSLIVAPTSLMGNWRREIQHFASALTVLVLHGPERQALFDSIDRHDIILTSYPLLHRDQQVLLQEHFHYIVLDEAQYIKNPNSQTAQVSFQLKANHRLALSGTPMENHLGELWSIYHFLMPGFLSNLKQFNQLFRKPIENDGDEFRQKQLNQRVTPFLLRRCKQDVLAELPDKTEIICSVTLQGKQRDLYESVRLAMSKKVRDEIAEKGLARSQIMILDALLKLRQTCCDPRIVSLPQAKKVTQSAKLTLLMDILPEMLEEGRKVLVFSQFTKMLALIEQELKEHGIRYSKLTGQTRKRDETINSFQQGETPVFLISLKAGGVGLNLTAADTVIHYDPWWNPAVEKQATDRAHRIGQKKAVFVYKLVTEGTVEEKIIEMQKRKQALADAVYSGKGGKKANAISSKELGDLLGAIE